MFYLFIFNISISYKKVVLGGLVVLSGLVGLGGLVRLSRLVGLGGGLVGIYNLVTFGRGIGSSR